MKINLQKIYFQHSILIYAGPIDGHDLGELLAVLDEQKKKKGPAFCIFVRPREKA